MATRALELSLHDPQWAVRYEALANDIRRAVGKQLAGLEHVGSTAVPGLVAKPIIDLAAAVASVAAADACVAPLTKRGWTYRGLHGDDPSRRYYVREEGERRVAHLHLWILPAAGWTEQLYFRDRLRADAALRDAYAREKLRLIVAVAGDRLAYSEAKTSFIRTALGVPATASPARPADDP